MDAIPVFAGLITVGLVGVTIGITLERNKPPPTYNAQWESVYVTCTRSGGDQTEARRTECIAAADRVMKCAQEVKP